MEYLGRHVLLELYDCNREQLDDLEYLRTTMLNAAEEVGATVINDVFHQFSPQGVTGVVAIAESHLCIHTWPEYGYAAVDIFTCGESFDPKNAAKLLIERLESKNPELTQVERGMVQTMASQV
ncbi:MAG: adenosylmethionine decarboxylase [Chloroflexi bacterium]|nr:adenosylmethionine decarboxylase [Chloroflexota bacterium]